MATIVARVMDLVLPKVSMVVPAFWMRCRRYVHGRQPRGSHSSIVYPLRHRSNWRRRSSDRRTRAWGDRCGRPASSDARGHSRTRAPTVLPSHSLAGRSSVPSCSESTAADIHAVAGCPFSAPSQGGDLARELVRPSPRRRGDLSAQPDPVGGQRGCGQQDVCGGELTHQIPVVTDQLIPDQQPSQPASSASRAVSATHPRVGELNRPDSGY